ncbi:fas-binding factor 1 homolog isoform X2 [Hermetia illucens]|nr:fas-binding factor 1 homolog isoform X2 [Hermetia illucens]
METKKPTTNLPQRPQTSGGTLKDETKIFSRQSTETTESTVAGTSILSNSRPKTAVGQRQSVASSNDPLGLFAPTVKETSVAKESRETPKPSRRKATAADWLGLEPETKPEKEPPVPDQPKEQPPPPQPQVLQVHDIPPAPSQLPIPQPMLQTFNPASNTLLLAASNLESQNALQALQQQEAQVMLATQMKNQETALLEMQQRQQQLLVAQEAQFNNLVQKQLTRQNQLEATIRAQQERINAHIQMLMSQPQMVPVISDAAGDLIVGKKPKENQEKLEEVELEADVKRLELEKLRLEDLISNVNANHEKEIEFMENSHRKQIQVLEENYQNAENRLKDEIKNIQEHYSKKLDMLESEKKDIIAGYETKLKDAANEYEDNLKKLKENYKSEIDTLRAEHKTMIENIRQSKLLEFAVVQDNTSYLQTLKSASSNLENVSGDLQTLRDELYSRIEIAHKERDAKLESRERAIEDKERHLKIIEETAEQERNRLMGLVATLETQLSKLTKETSEEQWALRQKISTLEVERSSFEKEKQFAKEQLQREEKHIEDLKQYQLEEHQRLTQQIQDEKQLITVERAKLEAAKKLQAISNTDQLKCEAEAALKVAQDAARQADQERERYLNMQRQLETLKRELVDEQNTVRQKQDELESSTYSVKGKERSVQEALYRARQAEQNFNAKVQVLQAQIRQTVQREAQLSQDRVDLSRQRFELQEIKKRLETTKCSLCRIGEKNNEISQILTRDKNDGIPINPVPAVTTTAFNYGYLGYPQSAIDHLFDDDLAECLRRMQTKDRGANLTADFDYASHDQLPQGMVAGGSHTVPTQTLESDLLEATLDAQQAL